MSIHWTPIYMKEKIPRQCSYGCIDKLGVYNWPQKATMTS